MSIHQKLAIATGAFSLIAATFFSLWWFFGHVAQANDTANTQKTLVKIVEGLAAIHVKIDTEEEAKKTQLKELCATGKMKKEFCPNYQPLAETERGG